MVITLRVICPQNQGFYFFFIFLRVGILALENLDTQLLLKSTMIGHGVKNKTKVSDSWYDLVVKGQGHLYLELVHGLKREYLCHLLT